MLILKNLILAMVLLLSFAYVEGIGISFGPFDLQFGETYSGYGPGPAREAILDSPICRAISQQKKLEFIVETEEKINNQELKITTKRISVEPYAFGFTREGQPVLRGAVTDEKLVREVTIKSAEQLPDHNTAAIDQKENQKHGLFAGLFRSHKSKDNVESFNITKVNDMRVLEDSHFDAPKGLDTIFKEDIARVVCHVLPAQKT